MLLSKLEFFIALRYLFTKQKERFISIINLFACIGIALGVATLIIVMAVMNGYEKELIDKILGIKGHLTISTDNFVVTDYEQLVELLSNNVNRIQLIAPCVEGQGMVTSKQSMSGVIIKGIDGTKLQQKQIMQNAIKSGSISDYMYGEGVLIGIALSNMLGIGVGDYIKLMVPQFTTTIVGMIPRMKSYKIVGIFDLGMHEYNQSTIFMPLLLAQKLFSYDRAVTHVEIAVNSIRDTQFVQNDIASILGPGYIISNWEMSNKGLATALRVERNVMFIILSLIIMIAAFNIISSLMLLVKDKAKGIAILRTIGVTRGSVVKIFIFCGFCIGLAGTVLGTLLGIVVALNIEKMRQFFEYFTNTTLFDPTIYYLTHLPAELSIREVLATISISLILSFFATIYPAWKIAKMTPTQVLRYE
ncbi:lipoprotein-releasing system permease protein [Alphaproteobacteria bacterium]